MLEHVFPSKKDSRIQSYNREELQVLEVYRNFAWPLRNWGDITVFLNAPELNKKIKRAQWNYVFKLQNWSTQYEHKTQQENAVGLQKILVEFIIETDLIKNLEDKINATLNSVNKLQLNAA